MNLNDGILDFSNARILVCGDVIVDKYFFGLTNRISPEAPVPVVKIENEENRLGGASNVAYNLSSIGCNVTLLGLIGDDSQGHFVINELNKKKIKNELIINSKIKTITKLRVLSKNMQLIRLDFEEEINTVDQNLILEKFSKIVQKFNFVIFSDYAKGALFEIDQLIKICRKLNIPTLVDPKQKNFQIYQGATFLKPNFEEFKQMVGRVSNDIEIKEKAFNLIARLKLKTLFITKGSEGIASYEKGGKVIEMDASSSEVFDVTGAGDTVTAILGMFLACGYDIKKSLFFANKAAGIVVGKLGTSSIILNDLEIINNKNSKFYKDKDLLEIIKRKKEKDLKIIMTNGCFDIIHAGHIDYLQKAKKLGDILIIAINTDSSIKKIKGEKRPLNKLQDRITVLSALNCVDYIISFEEKTPINIIKLLKPDILVKGADYKINEIVGAKFTINNGGIVKVLDLKKNLSTTNIIQKLEDL